MDMRARRMDWDVIERDKYGRVVSLTAWSREASDIRPAIFLVPVDGSLASLTALNVALRLADQRPNAELHVLNVQVLGADDALDDSVERQGLQETEEVREFLAMNQVHYQLHIATGAPAQVIRDYARTHNVAEIVIGSHGRGYFEQFLLGSVAMDVLSHLLIPVTLVKSSDRLGSFPAEWVNWLVPCDGSAAALRAVRYVIRHVSQMENKPNVHLLNVKPYGTDEVARPLAMDWAVPQAAPGSGWASTADCLDNAISLLETAKLRFDAHVGVGDAASKILDAIEQYGCGHIAMGSRGLGALGGIVWGSVSQSVVQRAAIPVTLVK